MAKKTFLKRRPLQEEMSLQITSMADIFIIILVFLLKSYSTGSMNITPASGTVLPEAKTAEVTVEALKVEVAESSVLIEGLPVVTIQKYVFDPKELENNGVSKPLSNAFAKERKRQLLIAKSNNAVKIDSKIIVVADKKVPYSTIKAVLSSAAVNGYTDFKLAVVNSN